MIINITHKHFFFFFFKGHRDVTWVLVWKVFLSGSKLTEDLNTAPNLTMKVHKFKSKLEICYFCYWSDVT